MVAVLFKKKKKPMVSIYVLSFLGHNFFFYLILCCLGFEVDNLFLFTFYYGLEKKSYIGLVLDFMKNNHDIEGIKIETKKKWEPFFYIYKKDIMVFMPFW